MPGSYNLRSTSASSSPHDTAQQPVSYVAPISRPTSAQRHPDPAERFFSHAGSQRFRNMEDVRAFIHDEIAYMSHASRDLLIDALLQKERRGAQWFYAAMNAYFADPTSSNQAMDQLMARLERLTIASDRRGQRGDGATTSRRGGKSGQYRRRRGSSASRASQA